LLALTVFIWLNPPFFRSEYSLFCGPITSFFFLDAPSLVRLFSLMASIVFLVCSFCLLGLRDLFWHFATFGYIFPQNLIFFASPQRALGVWGGFTNIPSTTRLFGADAPQGCYPWVEIALIFFCYVPLGHSPVWVLTRRREVCGPSTEKGVFLFFFPLLPFVSSVALGLCSAVACTHVLGRLSFFPT